MDGLSDLGGANLEQLTGKINRPEVLMFIMFNNYNIENHNSVRLTIIKIAQLVFLCSFKQLKSALRNSFVFHFSPTNHSNRH